MSTTAGSTRTATILLPTERRLRRRSAASLSFAGVVSIALALTAKGEMAGDPDVMIAGLPKRTRDGRGLDEIIDAAIFETFESLPRGKRRDPDVVCDGDRARRAQRGQRRLGQEADGACAGRRGLRRCRPTMAG